MNFPTTGMLVNITGAHSFSGRVLASTDIALIVAVAADRTVTLRRNLASQTPEQWTLAGLPVTVAVRPQDFTSRLADLEERTREGR